MVAKGSKKRERRIAEGNREYETAVIEKAKADLLESRIDDDLFTVDRVGSKNARRRVEKETKKNEVQHSKSPVENKLIQRKVEALQNGEKTSRERHAEAARENKTTAKSVYDAWGQSITTAAPRPEPKNIQEEVTARHAIPAARATLSRPKQHKVPAAGYSYNPSEEQHQDLLAEALALEIRRQEELVRKEGSFHGMDLKKKNKRGALAWGQATAGPSAASAAAAAEPASDSIQDIDADNSLGSDDDSEASGEDGDEDEDEDEEGADGVKKLSRKQRALKIKKTRVQRNKEKEKKAAASLREKEQKLKVLLKSLNQVPKLVADMQKAKETKASMKVLRAAQKAAQDEENAKALTYKEAGLVPLNDELHGSLRTLIPKGNTASVLQDALVRSGDAVAKDRRNKKRGEHPHKAKNVKWVAKYKYD